MTRILASGVAVLDFIFHLDAFPNTAEKFRTSNAEISGGGNAANAAVAIARAGGTAYLAARLGGDEIAELITSGLKQEKVETSFTCQFDEFRSSFSSIYIDRRGERQIVNYRDSTLSMDAGWFEDRLKQKPIDGLAAVLSDTRWPNGAYVAMRHAKELGIPGIIDAESPVDEAIQAVKIASHVAFSAQGIREFTGLENIGEAACAAQKTLSGKVLATDGAHGTVAVENGEPVWYSTQTIDPVDTLAAGDVWHGTFALALAEGQSEPRAIKFANAAATIKCSRSGGRKGAPSRVEIDEILEK